VPARTKSSAANSTSVNLHQVLATFYRPRGKRTRIVVDEYAFPTDVYVLQSQMRLHGLDWHEHFVTVKNQARMIEEDRIVALMDELCDEIAMLVLPGVVYTTGQVPRTSLGLPKEAHSTQAFTCAWTRAIRSAPCRSDSTIGTSISRSGATTSI
jgi:kynureninase